MGTYMTCSQDLKCTRWSIIRSSIYLWGSDNGDFHWHPNVRLLAHISGEKVSRTEFMELKWLLERIRMTGDGHSLP